MKILVRALVLSMLLSGCGESEPIKIGFVGQLTGNYSDIGVQGRNGVQLAVENLNESGGINGRKLKLIVENDKNSVKGAIEADAQLIKGGVVSIIGHMTSSQTLGVESFIQDHQIPLISPTASSPLLSGKQDCIFRLNPSSDKSAAVMGNYAYTHLEKKRIAVLYDIKNQAYSLPYALSFITSFKELGGSVPLQFNFSSEEGVSWREVIDLIDEYDVSGVTIVASAADIAAFAKTKQEYGKTWKLYASGWAHTQRLLELGEAAVEGMVFIESFNRMSPRPAFETFRSRYVEQFGHQPLFAAGQGYESVLFLAEGLRRKSAYNGNLIEALQSIRSIEGLMGTLRFDKNGDVERPYFVSKIIDGDFHVIGSISD